MKLMAGKQVWMESVTETREHLLEVAIEKMVYGGEGLARTPDGVLLMQGVLAGENVQVLVGEKHHGVRRAQVQQLLTPSPQRIAPMRPLWAMRRMPLPAHQL